MTPQEQLKALQEEYAKCKKCPLHQFRKNIVFGMGAIGGIMLVGEAPGEEEDNQGIPFIGPSGRCLTQMLLEAGISPLYSSDHSEVNYETQIYITNVVLCRPVVIDNNRHKNRRPSQAEAKACASRLYREILIVEPTVIVVMGDVARELLIGKKLSVGDFSFARVKLEDRIVNYPAYFVYHPAYILRKGCSSDYKDYQMSVEAFRKVRLYDQAIYKLRKGENPFIEGGI